MKRIKHNNLLPWFTDDHGTLPAAYLASCEKFFKKLQATSAKRQASSNKRGLHGEPPSPTTDQVYKIL